MITRDCFVDPTCVKVKGKCKYFSVSLKSVVALKRGDQVAIFCYIHDTSLCCVSNNFSLDNILYLNLIMKKKN